MRKSVVLFLAMCIIAGASVALGASPRTLEEIQQSGVLRVGVENETWGRFHIWEKGEVQGFEIDLCDAIAQKLGIKAEYIPTPWGEGHEGEITGTLEKGFWGDWDVIAAGTTVTKAREKNVVFSTSIFTGGQVLLVREDSEIATLNDCGGKKIGALQNSSSLELITKDLPEAISCPFETTSAVFEALLAGDIAGVVVDSPLALGKIQTHSGTLSIVDTPLSREHLALVLPKDCDTKLLEKVNDVVKKERKDLFKKWFR